jgi:pyridoxamine 5'-phosphate oxidase
MAGGDPLDSSATDMPLDSSATDMPLDSSASDMPLDTLAQWLEEARQRGMAEPEAMALATATSAGVPSVRIVLCRGIDSQGIRFFTNYESRKGRELDDNPAAAATFFWPVLDRQVRVEGRAERLPAADSDAYFDHRRRGHQISAWASAQSRPLSSLEALKQRAGELERAHEGRPVPRPPYWGGYLLRASSVELWSRGADRLHDRVRYERGGAGWTSVRLAP